MPLPSQLRDTLLSSACPHCGHRFERRASWFKSVGRFRCEGCGQEIRLTYTKKVELFENYFSQHHPAGPEAGASVPPLSFECPVTGAPCEQPQCKSTLCVIERDAGRVDAHAIVEADRYRTEATEVARAWFEGKGKRAPSKQQLRKVASHPQIIAEAKRRLAEKAGLQSTIHAVDLSSLSL